MDGITKYHYTAMAEGYIAKFLVYFNLACVVKLLFPGISVLHINFAK